MYCVAQATTVALLSPILGPLTLPFRMSSCQSRRQDLPEREEMWHRVDGILGVPWVPVGMADGSVQIMLVTTPHRPTTAPLYPPPITTAIDDFARGGGTSRFIMLSPLLKTVAYTRVAWPKHRCKSTGGCPD